MLLQSILERSVERHPDKPFVVCGQNRHSYGEVDRAANRLAHVLIDGGVRRGDRVAICLDNTPEAVIAIFGVLKAGAVFMMVNPTTKTDKLAYILQDSEAHTLIMHHRRARGMTSAFERAQSLRRVISVGGHLTTEQVAGCETESWEDCQHEYVDRADRPVIANISVDLAALIYTSGSTGNPKGVMLTHLNMLSAARSITTYLRNEPHDRILNVLPLSFDYGLYQALMAARFGGTLILEKSFTYPHAILEKLVSEEATGFPLVPTMSAILLQMDLSKYDFSKLRYVTNTGAALPSEHILQLRKLLPHVQVYSMYGLTECKRVSYLPPEEIDERVDSVGKAMPDTEVYLVDEQGHRLPPGETGELVVRGANVMQGYWRDPVRTAERLKTGEWPHERVLHTGDLFRMDTDGYLYFVGRRDDMIKSRGEKVSPREVEGVLHAHPQVAEAAIIGVDDPVLGQAIHAFVVARDNAQLEEREILAHCRRNLEDFMVPQVVSVVPELPRSANGKIDKKTLVGANQ